MLAVILYECNVRNFNIHNELISYEWNLDVAIVLIRFTNFEDLAWFNKTMIRVINEELGEANGAMVEPTHYFVDFMKWVPFP
jgi:menaquinone-dependent protoporphyrinogen IX oxidase